MKRALTIAGSDSGGGAGLQADLHAFARCGVFGMCAVTLVTAQNTLGVTALQMMPPALVTAQIEAVASDIGVDVVKTGALGEAAIIAVVAEAARGRLAGVPWVVDPVIVSRRGAVLVSQDAIEAMLHELMPLATLLTPNIHEAAVLSGIPIDDVADMTRAGQSLVRQGARAVLVKGGALRGDTSVDVLVTADGVRTIERPRLHTPHTHGTGCTLAATIAGCIARDLSLVDAIETARDYVQAAIAQAPGLGGGSGPLLHAAGVFPWDNVRA